MRPRAWFAVLALFLRAGFAAAEQAEPPPVELAALGEDGSAATFAPGAGAQPQAFAFEATYKADLLRRYGGGAGARNAYLGNLDLKTTVDGERALRIPGGSFHAYLLSNHGSKPNNRLGTGQGISNIEVGTNTSKLYEAWYEQTFFDAGLSSKVGLYDLNSEFYVTEASGLFLHPALGIGTEFSQTGANGPSIFPTTSLGARLRALFGGQFYAQSVVLDAVAGDPDQPRGTRVHLRAGEGALLVSEAGFAGDARPDAALSPTKLALGYWRYTARFDDVLDTDAAGNPLRRRNHGAYLLAESRLLRDADDSARTLTGFVRYGVAPSAINEFDRAWAAGLVWQGALPGRAEDQLGFAVASARLGAKFRAAAALAGDPVARRETAYELTYAWQVNGHLMLQPELQRVVRAGGTDALRSTLVGLRVQLSY